MIKYNKSFKDNWANLNGYELEGLNYLDRGMKVIFDNLKQENIIAIYLKGSFLRREMNSKSDVDTVVICKTDEEIKILNDLQEKMGNSKELNFGFSGYTLEELKTGKLNVNFKSDKAQPSRFTRLLPSYFLLYGEELNREDLYQKSDLELFKSLIKAFDNIFIPNYEKGNINFDMILKQSLWLLELEVSVRDKNFRFTSWKDLASYFDEKHFINDILRFRKQEKVSKGEKEKFLKNLEKYLEKLNNYCLSDLK